MLCSGSSAKEASESLAMDYPNPMVAEHRANRGEDNATRRPSHCRGLRPARSGPNASCPNGLASGDDANPIRSLRRPARWEVPRQARSRQDKGRVGPPVPMPIRPDRTQTPGSMRAFPAP
jgi:hypothetical protein